jgi:hypothetical protein
MEQTMNPDRAPELSEEDGVSSWRSIGSLATGWAARMEAQRDEAEQQSRWTFVPAVWAAE